MSAGKAATTVVGLADVAFHGGWDVGELVMMGGVRRWPAAAWGGTKGGGDEEGIGLTKLVRRPGETWR